MNYLQPPGQGVLLFGSIFPLYLEAGLWQAEKIISNVSMANIFFIPS